jgi:large subunit ribosomal protein L18e
LIAEINSNPDANRMKFWKAVVKELEKSARQRREVNLYRINKNLKEGQTALVPGKVLSIGELTKKVTVAAYAFSEAARIKINSRGKAISISQMLKENPKAKNARIMG